MTLRPRRSNKDFLKKLLERNGQAWLAAPVLPEFVGATHLHTPRKVIGFRDGVCVEVVMRDTGARVADPILGMRVAGWLEPGSKKLVAAWRPGASAILFRLIDEHGNAAVAMTSPSFAFFYAGNQRMMAPDPRDVATSRFHHAPRAYAPAPRAAPLAPGSMTRMFY